MTLELRHWDLIRHSNFVIRHCAALPCPAILHTLTAPQPAAERSLKVNDMNLSESTMKRFLAGLLMLSAVSLSPAFAADEAASVAPAQPAGPPTVLVPVKNWFAPSQPIEIKVSADGPVTLTMTDFTG